MIKSDYIVFDCETGGLDEKKNPITQYAAVILDGVTLKEKARWETYVKPYNDLVVEQQALDSTMVTMSDINAGVSLKEFTDTLVKWWERYRAKSVKSKEAGRLVPVGHNVTFDIRFVNEALRLSGHDDIQTWLYPNFIDTYALSKLAWGIKGDEKLKLSACCERAGIKLVDAHGAMNDVEATAQLFRWFMKKLRAKKGEAVNGETAERPSGAEFFEFRCGK